MFILYNELTDAQVIERLSHSTYMFRKYCCIIREFVVGTLPSYTSMTIAVVVNTVYIISHSFYAVEISLFKIQHQKTYVKYLNFELYYQ